MAKLAKLGSGKRFASLKAKLAGKVSNPGAVAASIGRKKYGKARFQKLAAKGKKRKSGEKSQESKESKSFEKRESKPGEKIEAMKKKLGRSYL